MKPEGRRCVTFRIVLLVPSFILFRITIVSAAGTPDQTRSIHQFDFGTETSPVGKSAVRITGTDNYDKTLDMAGCQMDNRLLIGTIPSKN